MYLCSSNLLFPDHISTMNPDLKKLDELLSELQNYKATLVAVSKTKPATTVKAAYDHAQLDFGENYVQELLRKHEALPENIRWHFIGHLQSNKVKLLVPFVTLIHGIDSFKLLQEVNKQAAKINRVQDVLLQVHIATEESKFGFSVEEAMHFSETVFDKQLTNIRIRGLMGMASFSDDQQLVAGEFKSLKKLFDSVSYGLAIKHKAEFTVLSMGMSGDYKIALNEGSNMVRIGSAIFGVRN